MSGIIVKCLKSLFKRCYGFHDEVHDAKMGAMTKEGKS